MRTASLLFLLLVTLTPKALAEPLRIAVASNFKPALEQLLPEFNTLHPEIPVLISASASGQLFAQITQGAPFDLFLSADALYPSKLHNQGLALAPQAYAQGKLLVLSRKPAPDWQSAVRNASRLALANPALAPYGAAAQSVLIEANLWSSLEQKAPALASNIAQVQQWYDTGNVDVAFVAAALYQPRKGTHVFDISATLKHPIEQHMAILTRSQQQENAARLCAFLRNHHTQQQLQQLGYQPMMLAQPAMPSQPTKSNL